MNSQVVRCSVCLLEMSGEIAQEKNEEAEPMQKQHPVVNVTGGGSKKSDALRTIIHRNLEC